MRAASRAGLLALAVLTALPAAAETLVYAVVPAASHVRIHLGRGGLVRFLGHEHHIEAPIVAGRIEVREGDPSRSSVRLRFESARLAIVPGSEPADDIPRVEQRMRGPEVLEVARYPEIAFASTAVSVQATDGPRVRLVVAGTLTLRGRAFPVEIPLEVGRDATGIDAHGEVWLTLRELDIEPPSVAGVVKVANRFRLELEVRAEAAVVPR